MFSWCVVKLGSFIKGIYRERGIEIMLDPEFLMAPRIITDSYSNRTHAINIGSWVFRVGTWNQY
jgi:hypothetical protein